MAVRNPKVRSRIVMTVFEGGQIPHHVEFFGEPMGTGDLERLISQAQKERKRYHLSRMRADQEERAAERKTQLEEESNARRSEEGRREGNGESAGKAGLNSRITDSDLHPAA